MANQEGKVRCPNCGSDQIAYQTVSNIRTKGRSVGWWIYFFAIGWAIEFMMWVVATIPMLLIRIFHKGKTETKLATVAVCQNCGHTWKREDIKI